ncbi:MAG: DUF6434 domain-containing protein [Leptospiraceae bacterium]|nr:DUF6434 domain-containing protein [Leptospiraceae bacterium]
MKRPAINKIKNGDELKGWYWLKQELVDFCKVSKISYVGSKFEILERISTFLEKSVVEINKASSYKQTSKFDWSKSKLNLDTIITDSYANGQNVRIFFKKHCGDKFHFSIPFMSFMKNNCGKTLQDAVNEWHRLNEQKKDKNFKSQIPEGNQFNKYIRDFFEDNPNMTIEQARHFWKLKRSLPLRRHVYERSDLKLK